jgi:hypothetical protein
MTHVDENTGAVMYKVLEPEKHTDSSPFISLAEDG